MLCAHLTDLSVNSHFALSYIVVRLSVGHFVQLKIDAGHFLQLTLQWKPLFDLSL